MFCDCIFQSKLPDSAIQYGYVVKTWQTLQFYLWSDRPYTEYTLFSCWTDTLFVIMSTNLIISQPSNTLPKTAVNGNSWRRPSSNGEKASYDDDP